MKSVYVLKRIFLSCLIVFFSAVSVSAQDNVDYFSIDGHHGKISGEIIKPELNEGQKYPIVILCHGFAADREWGCYRAIIANLKAEGIASVIFDFNGHGKSEGEFVDMTMPNEVVDLKCVIDYVSQQPFFNGVIHLVGHSQGGVVVGLVAGELRDAIRSVVLLAPASILREDVIRGNTFGVEYDPVNPPPYILIGHHKLGAEYIRTAFSLPIFDISAAYKGAALIIHGMGDRLVPYSCGENYHRIWSDNSELVIIPSADHSFTDPTHMAQVIDNTSSFLVEHSK